MEAAMELAGYFTAHAIYSVCDGESLIPLVACETVNGKRQLHVMASERLEESAERGLEWLATNPEHATRAVLVYDGFLTLDDFKFDALIVIIRDYTLGEAEITMAVPYRPSTGEDDFTVHRPKFINFKGVDPDWEKIGQALWHGIEQHEEGAEVWNEHLDESV
ncbi:hypothetical protein K2Y11_24850 [bacterium]|nr:hypothetical protein [bacterium]